MNTLAPIIIIPAYQPNSTLLDLISTLELITPSRFIIVNDGSSHECAHIFAQLKTKSRVDLLEHTVNIGKGGALKTAFKHYLAKYSANLLGVIVADADGQHDPQDINKVLLALQQDPNTLILGTRTFNKQVPLRSRLGNFITKKIFAMLIGGHIHDTQTGLRAIPRAFIPQLLASKFNRYEFELHMLILAVRSKLPIIACPIQTIYSANNASSHFNPLLDSLRIYAVFIRFLCISICSGIIDYVLFCIVNYYSGYMLLGELTARLCSGLFNFSCNRKYVFKSKNFVLQEAMQYICLAGTMLIVSYGLLTILVVYFNMNVYFSKIFSMLTLFIANFIIQKTLIFTKKIADVDILLASAATSTAHKYTASQPGEKYEIP